MSETTEQVQQVTITEQQASRRYGISDRTLRQYAHEGKLATKRFGRLKFYLVKQLDELFVPVVAE